MKISERDLDFLLALSRGRACAGAPVCFSGRDDETRASINGHVAIAHRSGARLHGGNCALRSKMDANG